MNQQNQELLTRLNNGDKKALRELFDQYYPYLVSVVLALSKDIDLAKDTAQDVFFQVWKKRESLRIQTSLKPYLRRAAINHMLNKLKAKRIQLIEEEDLSNTYIDRESPESTFTDKELAQVLHKAIDQLPEKCRLVFQLCRIEGLSHKEVSEKLGISPKTIENQMTKALKHLRQVLAQYQNTPMALILIDLISLWGKNGF